VAPDIISETVAVGSVKVLDGASLPKYPIPPATMRNAALGLLMGFVFGTVFILAWKWARPTVIQAIDIRSKLELPVVGSMPHIKNRAWGKKRKVPLIVDSNVNINFYEAIKSFRTNILHLSEKENFQTILIAGAASSEGKTTSAVNLALSLCSQYKVLLVDADMHKPNIMRALNIQTNNNVPLNLLLKNPERARDFISVEPLSGLSVLTFKEAEMTSDLLGITQFKALIDLLRDDYDFVIIDSPPARTHADATIMSQCVDAVILTIRQDHAPIEVIEQTQNNFAMIQAKVIGCVFTDVHYIRVDSAERYRSYHRKKIV